LPLQRGRMVEDISHLTLFRMISRSWHEYYNKDSSIGVHLNSLAGHACLLEEVIRQNPKRILEVGSGTGVMAVFFSWLGYGVVSVDNNRGVLDQAERLNRDLNGHSKYKLADAFELSSEFARDSFDVAFSQGFFEHFSDQEIHQLVTQQLAVANCVIFSVPSKYYGVREYGNERLLLPTEWRVVLKEFSNVCIRDYHQKVRSLSSIIRKSLISPSWIIPWKQNEHVLVTVRRDDSPR